ncbi:type II toxin-antitoxin system VapC family toxin [Microbacterium sp. bgisy189]|uniref:type II toxin-antitoxin system VapC family toxin n=1 Tax=Microbacterium sp. bgisy189 TaxID=3413798 RepID=UPI003EB94C99
MSRRVVDASAFLDAVLPTDRQDAALRALSGHELWAPAILDLEVTSALWRLARTSAISLEEAERGLARLHDAPIRRVDHVGLAGAAWRSREAIRISDGFYVAAAHALAADLLTSDARLSRAPSLGVTVTLLR